MNPVLDNIIKRLIKAHDDDLRQNVNEIYSSAVHDFISANDHRALCLLMTYCLSKTPELNDKVQETAELCAQKSEQNGDKAMAAIYHLILGKSYDDGYGHSYAMEEEFHKALANPEYLANVNIADYNWLVTEGKDNKMFDNSLLAFIGVQTNNYDVLYTYYRKTSNRSAACFSKIKAIENDDTHYYSRQEKLKLLMTVIKQYDDQPIVCEAVRYIIDANLMKYDVDDEWMDSYYDEDNIYDNKYSEKVYRFVTKYINKFSDYERIDELKHIITKLQQPYFSLSHLDKIVKPDKSFTVAVNYKNTEQLTISVYKTSIIGRDSDYDQHDEEDIKRLWNYACSEPFYTKTYTYDNNTKHLTRESQIEIQGLPLGIYLVELKSNYGGSQTCLLHVSNIAAIAEQMPYKQCRIVVVDGVTGHPVPQARVDIIGRDKSVKNTLVCDSRGEVIADYNLNEYYVFPYTDTDKYCKKENIFSWSNYSYTPDETQEHSEIVTDRAIYRPGQTIHVAIICCSVDKRKNVNTLSKQMELKLSLNSYTTIAQTIVKTNNMGVAYHDFVIPDDAETGGYTISCGNSYDYYGLDCSKHIRIEEYKRPTFEVKFNDYSKPYKVGDTVTLDGIALSYTGVPITNATVRYRIKRARAWWWYSLSRFWEYAAYHGRYSEKQFQEGTAMTDGQGHFSVDVPMTLQDADANADTTPLFMNIIAEADVTDSTGEMQTGRTSLELSNRSCFVYAMINSRFEISEDFKFKVLCKNASGQDLDKEFEYWFDDQEEILKARTNTTTAFIRLGIGKHILHIKCNDEEEEREFYIFDKNGNKTPYKTEKWMYQSSDVFPENGDDVILQIGCSTEDTYIIYNIFSGNRIIESGAELVPSGMINRHLHYKDEYGGGVLVTYAWLRNRTMQTFNFTITKPFRDRQLQMSWRTFRDHVTPGTQEHWILNVKDHCEKDVTVNVIATMYDKSLDKLVNNDFTLHGPWLHWNTPDTKWEEDNNGYISLRYVDIVDEKKFPFDFSRFIYCPKPRPYRRNLLGGARLCACAVGDASYDSECEDFQLACPTEASVQEESDQQQVPDIKLRSNMGETAFFMPNLRTDDNGNINIDFLLPDSLTTWIFKATAHTKDMCIANFTAETIARKQVMVQPNMPRFVRVGDETTISAKVVNTSEKAISGTIVLELLDADGERLVSKEVQKFGMDINESQAFSFRFTPDEEIKSYICKIYAYGEGFNDGEQHLLTVLTNKADVTVTHVISQDGASTDNINVAEMLPEGSTRRNLSMQYTNRPIWLAINALPAMTDYESDDAISVAVSLYCNLVTDHLQRHASQYGNIELVKPSELKRTTDKLVNKLRDLQFPCGGFSWYKSMPESFYITTEVLMHLARIHKFIGEQEKLWDVINKAFAYCDDKLQCTAQELRTEEKAGKEVSFPSFSLLQHMYSCAILERRLIDSVRLDYSYLVGLLMKDIHIQTMREKAMTAMILEYIGNHDKAQVYAESLRQYTTCNDDGERTFDTPRAPYSWYSYKIPTHVAGMEALSFLCPDDVTTIRQMQKWLLQQKRTEMWETPIDSVNSVYALLIGADEYLTDNRPTEFYSDGVKLRVQSTGNEGIVKAILPVSSKSLSVKKMSNGISWGAVFAHFLQPMSEVMASGSGMSIKREIITDKLELHVGDRITIRLTYNCDRDYDLVTVFDSKAACMEPVNQLSWRDSFVHVQPLDKETRYSYYGLSKGTHSIQTEYYVDRPGTYEIGTATIKCTYTPEFTAVCPSQKLVVLP